MYVIKDETVRQNCIREIMSLGFDKPCSVQIKPYKHNKTTAQRNYWHALLRILARDAGYNMDDLKDDIKIRILGFRSKMMADRGEVLYIPSSETLTVDDYNKLIEGTLMMFDALGYTAPAKNYYGL